MIALAIVLSCCSRVVYFACWSNAPSTGFRPLRPQFCSIYDPYFWWHERFWKLSVRRVPRGLQRHPVQEPDLAAARRPARPRVFDDGCSIPERTLVTIGDDCTLNAGSIIQCHSQEDGAFKSDRTTIGAGCTLGVGAFVHYGVTMGDGAVLAPDSFLMKGEEVPPDAHWGGTRPESSTAALPSGIRTSSNAEVAA